MTLEKKFTQIGDEVREYNAEEYAQAEIDLADAKRIADEAEAKAEAKAAAEAKLVALGLDLDALRALGL